MSNILYIGLHGYAGSGKDTVAKALRLMLSYNWNSFEEFRSTWETEAFKMRYATNISQNIAIEDETCYCVAFADQLKNICAAMFGIPIERFYYNKDNAWICINDNFRYTERQPNLNDIITAEQYHIIKNSFGISDNTEPKWMLLREILVYVGTYICQRMINRECFVNGVANNIKHISSRNDNLKYVICTDVRFFHELDFIKKNNGINITITRSSVDQMENIAEHDFDDDDIEDIFDFVINNDGTYDELLMNLWNLVHDNEIFKNINIKLISRDGTNNYLRKIDKNKYICMFEYTARVSHDNGHIVMIDPSGGPLIHIGSVIDNIPGIVTAITFDDKYSKYVLEFA